MGHFNYNANMFIMGSGEGFEIPEGFEYESYTDPFSGMTYVSLLYNDYERLGTHIYPVGTSMVKKANELLAIYEDDPGDYSKKYDLLNHRERMDILMVTNRAFDDEISPEWVIEFWGEDY